jgi:hypothetical protein
MHERPMTEADRERLLGDGATAQGVVMDNQPADADQRISRVRVHVSFKDGQIVEFTEELASLYQPEPGSPAARGLAELRGAEQLRHPDRIPKIQLPLFRGERVPVRYDAADPNRIVIDGPALHERALHDYIKRVQRPKEQAPARPGAGVGPPWVVPTRCPNCGAPVDQAKASQDRDPHCLFCHEPVPVTPVR